MSQELQTDALRKENNELQIKCRKLEEYVRQIELKNLSYQIKPHFMFNTLNIIARLILLNRNAEAMDITYALSKLLRFSLEKKDLVRLYEELQHVRNYFLIIS
ncbi:MAG: histidine kinase [Bacillota bacterium]